jgi:hypothetical protein
MFNLIKSGSICCTKNFRSFAHYFYSSLIILIMNMTETETRLNVLNSNLGTNGTNIRFSVLLNYLFTYLSVWRTQVDLVQILFSKPFFDHREDHIIARYKSAMCTKPFHWLKCAWLKTSIKYHFLWNLNIICS